MGQAVRKAAVEPRAKRGAFTKGEWSRMRMEKFRGAVRYAAAAKALRIAHNVTQREIAKHYGVSAVTVSHWESGAYFSWDTAGLSNYAFTCRRLAR